MNSDKKVATVRCNECMGYFVVYGLPGDDEHDE